MTTTNAFGRLIDNELQAKLENNPLYSQDGKKKDAKCIAVFLIGNIRWYVLEGQPEGTDFILYGHNAINKICIYNTVASDKSCRRFSLDFCNRKFHLCLFVFTNMHLHFKKERK